MTAGVTAVLPAEAVSGSHLVPVPLVVDGSEDENVEDEEGGPDGDGNTTKRFLQFQY